MSCFACLFPDHSVIYFYEPNLLLSGTLFSKTNKKKTQQQQQQNPSNPTRLYELVFVRWAPFKAVVFKNKPGVHEEPGKAATVEGPKQQRLDLTGEGWAVTAGVRKQPTEQRLLFSSEPSSESFHPFHNAFTPFMISSSPVSTTNISEGTAS